MLNIRYFSCYFIKNEKRIISHC